AMLMGDFMTAVQYDLPVVAIVLNNAKLAFITLEQQAKGLPDWGTDLVNPDFAAIARACGGLGLTVTKPADLAPAIKQAMMARKPAVIDVAVDADELIMPPKITVSQAVNFGLAKIREAFGA
ncbi:MAG: pyruvate oxidase, partial [Alphaproteobacteria bacterium]